MVTLLSQKLPTCNCCKTRDPPRVGHKTGPLLHYNTEKIVKNCYISEELLSSAQFDPNIFDYYAVVPYRTRYIKAVPTEMDPGTRVRMGVVRVRGGNGNLKNTGVSAIFSYIK